MSTYIREEQETCLVFEVETGEWNVYSTVPKHIRKLMSIGDMTVIDTEDNRPTAIKGKITEKQVSMKKVREMTEEQRQAAADRLSKARENK